MGDPNTLEISRKNGGDDSERELARRESIRKKRLKFDTIPIKTVLEAQMEEDVELSDDSGSRFVKTTDGFTELYSPVTKNKIKLKAGKNKIASKYIKRIDLRHIEDLIENNHFHSVVPDFGFDNNILGEGKAEGWRLFLDFVSNHYKYERLENYVSARQHERE